MFESGLVGAGPFVIDGIYNCGATPPAIYWSYDNRGRQTSAWWSNHSSGGPGGTAYQQMATGYGFVYNATSAQETTNFGNGTVETVSYDQRLQPTSRTVPGVLGLTASFSGPSAGNNGNVFQVGDSYDATGNFTYTYDYLNRLATSSGPGSVLLQTTYDRWGNKSQAATGNGPHKPLSFQTGSHNLYFNGKLVFTNTAAMSPSTVWLHTDHLGTVRVKSNASGQAIAGTRMAYFPFGERVNVKTDPVKYEFTGKERDDDTKLDYFGARYYANTLGRFTRVDPVRVTTARLMDPQQLNLYAYTRNNPLSAIDPDGREVRVLDNEALNRIRSTVSENLRSSIRVDKKGFIDRKALAKVKTKDENFNDLRTAVNASGTLEVATAASVKVGELGDTEFFFTSKEQVQKELDVLGVISTEAAIDQLFLGYTDDGLGGATRVTLSDGTGKAATAPVWEHAVTAAHEIYGHGLPKIQGRAWKHDDRGPVDRNIKRIEDRTRRLYGKP